MILVTGDVVLDHNIYAGPRSTPVSPAMPGTRFDKQPGGAMLTFGLLRQLADSEVQFGLGNVSVQDLEHWPGNFHYGALWEPAGGHWRLARHLGYGAPRAGKEKSYPGAPVPGLDELKPQLLVIDDGGLGFRHRTADKCWPKILTSPSEGSGLEWIVVKMSRPLARGDLWRTIASTWHRKLIVIVSADNLRHEDAQISLGLSWESTVDDIVDEVQSNPILQELQNCRHLIVTLRGEGAVWFDQTEAGPSCCRLVFDRELSEGETESRDRAFGFLSAMTASVAWRLRAGGDGDLTEAIQAGLSTTRFLRDYGHGPVEAECSGFPFAPAAEHIRKPSSSCATADVPCSTTVCAASEKAVEAKWSILGRTFQSEDFPGPLFGAARRLALFGPASLENVPYGRFGKLLTMDRSEIEGLRHMRKQMLEYQGGREKRPLSLAVFGAPGCGKSFGLKQIAVAVFGAENPTLEFNLSQFKGPEDLIGAFHQIRDHALAGKTPVAFWDEFDSRNYDWLQYFLAPMQDGTFQEDQYTHAIGRSVFVFAGGTCHHFSDFGRAASPDKNHAFRLAKGPDFKSRLAGFLDILGPNPGLRYDKSLVGTDDDPWQDDTRDVDFPVRRAILLRSLLGMIGDKENATLEIDRGLLTALLAVPHYRNGARSMEKLIQQTRAGGDGVLRRAHLPPVDQLALYVDDIEEFHRRMRQAYEFQAKAEEVAVFFHEDWRKNLLDSEKGRPYDVAFKELGHEGKEANIAAAFRMPEILALAGLRLETGEASPEEKRKVEALLKRHLEFLAEQEHKGWQEQKRTEDWTRGESRDDKNRIHPQLAPFSELSDEQKEKDRRTIRNYPTYARAVGFKIVGWTSTQTTGRESKAATSRP